MPFGPEGTPGPNATPRRRRPAPRRSSRAAARPVGVFAQPLEAPVAGMRRTQRAKRRKAEERAPGPTVPVGRIPHGPLTPRQRDALIHRQEGVITRDVARHAGAKSFEELMRGRGDMGAAAQRMLDIREARHSGDRATRDALNQLAGARRARRRYRPDAQPDPRWNPNAGDQRGTTYRTQHAPKLGESAAAFGLPKNSIFVRGLNTTGDLLNLAGRPLYATAGAVSRVRRGEGLKGALEGLGRGLSGKERKTFVDVLEEGGTHGAVKWIAGLSGDLVFDPLNLLTFGAKTPANVLIDASRVARVAAARAEGAGKLERARALGARADHLEAQAAKAPDNRGLTIGLRAPVGSKGRSVNVPGVNRATAAASRAVGIPKHAERLRGSPVGQAIGAALVPGFRPAGISPAQWEMLMNLERRARASSRAGVRQAERRGKAYRDALKGHENGAERVINAVEQADKAPLMAAKIRRTLTAPRNIRHTPEVRRRAAHIRLTLNAARADEKGASRAVNRAQSDWRRQTGRAGRAQGRAEVLVPQADARAAKQVDTAAERLAKAEAAAARNTVPAARRERSLTKIEGAIEKHRANAARYEAEAARAADRGDEAAFDTAAAKLEDAQRQLAGAEQRAKPLRQERQRDERVAQARAEVNRRGGGRPVEDIRHEAAALRREAAATTDAARARELTGRVMDLNAEELAVLAGRRAGTRPVGALGNLEKQRAGEQSFMHDVLRAGTGKLRVTKDGIVPRAQRAERAASKNLNVTQNAARQGAAKLAREAPDLAARHAARVMGARAHHSIDELPEGLREIAQRFVREMDDVARAEERAGVGGARRASYVPHQWTRNLESWSRVKSKVTGRERNEFAVRRKLEGSVAELNASAAADGLPPIFSTDLAALVTARLAKGAKASAAARFRRDLIDHGIARPLKGSKTSLDRHFAQHPQDVPFVFGKDGLKPLLDKHNNIDVAEAAAAIKRGELVVSMNRLVGRRYAGASWRHVNPLDPTDGQWTVLRGFDRLVGALKTTLTALNVPAYDLRNLTGDLWNAHLADTTAGDIREGFSLILGPQAKRYRAEERLDGSYHTKRTVDLGAEKVNAKEALERAEKAGAINTGYIGAERYEVERALEEEGVRATQGRGLLGLHPVERLRKVSQAREDSIRMATWLRAKRRGMTDDEAAKWANAHHFDYGDLTDAERTVLKRIFPFWTFAARNTPIQLKRFLTNPGKFSRYEILRQELAQAAGLGDDWEQHLEPYQRRAGGIAFPVPGRKTPGMAYPALPLVDLARVGAVLSGDTSAGFDMTASMVNPLFKAPVEAASNHSFFFRGPIYRTDKEPDARAWVPAPWVPGPLRGTLGIEKKADRQQGGKKVWMWPATTDYWVRQLPQTNTAIQTATPARGSHGVSDNEQIASWLTGVRLGIYDRPTQKLRAAQRRFVHLKRRANDLEDDGKKGTREWKRLQDDIQSATHEIAGLKRAVGYKDNRRKRRGGGGMFGPGGGGGGGGRFGPGGGAGGAGMFGPG